MTTTTSHRHSALSDSTWPGTRISEADRAHVWHPYAPRHSPITHLPIVRSSGAYVQVASDLPADFPANFSGRHLLDGMSSWWAACHGHGHPALTEAAHHQIDTMSHVMFGGLTHRPAAELAERLCEFANEAPANATGEPMTSVFFSDSGSVSVEVAMKMALQAQRGMGSPHKTTFMTWRGGYHGDTFHPMSVCDPDGGMHSLWSGSLRPQAFIPAPPARGAAGGVLKKYGEELRAAIDNHGGIAAMIIEPVVQGAGGMRFHDHSLLREVRRACDATGTLLIADEIATGFGRTGTGLATTAAGIRADILCLGKALTGGFMSFAATLASDAVAAAIDTPAGGGALMHGPTFMGNPLACAVSLAALDLYDTGYWREPVTTMERQMAEELDDLRDLDAVTDVRTLGAIGVVELHSPVDMAAATTTLVKHGVWLRPFGKLLYAMPPFICTPGEISAITAAMRAVCEEQAQAPQPEH